jgi:outer membrane protein assembly factor BamA
VTFAGELYDVASSVEEWHLSDAEAGLASFLFRRDYRDYYGRHGGQLIAALRATANADLTLSYGDERWRSRPTRNPGTLFNGDIAWRENPLMDAGRMHRLDARLRIDTRNDVFNPWAGWYVLADVDYGSGALTEVAPTSTGVRAVGPGALQYTRGFLDVRRYNRLAPNAALNLRGVLGGWMGGGPLPLERRLSIGGAGSVPGFDFRSALEPDVGTCSSDEGVPGRPAQCERIALAQLEYRQEMHLSISNVPGGKGPTGFRIDGAWVFFADAGRGWLVNAPGHPMNLDRQALPPLSTYRTDIGAGVDFSYIGFYVAKALSAPQEPMNLLVRLRHRF